VRLVVARTCVQPICTAAAVQRIVARAAGEAVRVAPAEQPVLAFLAV
jgi:hypothetical protein